MRCRATTNPLQSFDQRKSWQTSNAEEGRPNEKTIIVAAATVIVGAVAFKPVPAAAFFWVPIIMESKKDKNFKAVNPYGPKKAKASKKKR